MNDFNDTEQLNNNSTVTATADTVGLNMSIGSEEEAQNFVKQNPHLGNYFKKMIQEGIAEELRKPEKGKQITNNDKDDKEKNKNKVNLIKSPSDTTLYAPAMKKLINDGKNDKDHIIDRISNFVEEIRIETTRGMPATVIVCPWCSVGLLYS